MLSLLVSCTHLELSAAKSPKEQALVLSMILFQRGRKMTELCATPMELDYAFVEFPQLLRARAFPGFDVVVTLLIRLQIPDDRESRRGPLSVRCKNSKRRRAAKPSASITSSTIPVDVAAAVYKYPPLGRSRQRTSSAFPASGNINPEKPVNGNSTSRGRGIFGARKAIQRKL
jgi:hypothetical protein